MPCTWYVLEPTDISVCAEPDAKMKGKIQPVAVPLDTLPERRTMTIHPEISARGSLIPAGDGSKLLSDTCPPRDKAVREGKVGPLTM